MKAWFEVRLKNGATTTTADEKTARKAAAQYGPALFGVFRVTEEQVDLRKPHDIPSLCKYLEMFPRVRQKHFDDTYAVRNLVFYGNNVMTGAFQFMVEGRPAEYRDSSFATTVSYDFDEWGFSLHYRAGTVRYTYLEEPAAPAR